MPLIEVAVRRGRDQDQLREFMRALHDVAVTTLGIPDAAVRVILREIDADHWMAGGLTLAELAQRSTET